MRKPLQLILVLMALSGFLLCPGNSRALAAPAAGATPAASEPTASPSPAASPSPTASPTPTASPAPEKPQYVTPEDCTDCHYAVGDAFGRTPHARAMDPVRGVPMNCESCHGPASIHDENGGGAAGVINPAKLSPRAASQICLKCHEGMHGQADWRFSAHAAAGVSCIDCHKVHPTSKKDAHPDMLAKSQPELCYTCHEQQKAEASWPSHHPIKEGRLKCTDCHNPHGGGLSAYTGAPDARELCLKCHAQFRGPFAEEHPPVADSCLICHRPHGSVEPNLLVTSETMLCRRCHVLAHNPHSAARLLPAEQLQQRVLYFSRCTICHQEVHGSDVGPNLTR